MTLGRLRQDASQDEGQMDSLRHMMQRQREKEKADELRALTMRQNRLKQDRQQDTDQVLKLMKELQEQKRRELTARMEREQVKKALQGIEEVRHPRGRAPRRVLIAVAASTHLVLSPTRARCRSCARKSSGRWRSCSASAPPWRTRSASCPPRWSASPPTCGRRRSL